MYLSENLPDITKILSYLGFFTQAILILLISIKLEWIDQPTTNKPKTRSSTLPFTIFIITYIFVTFNKVCTSQYFLWYLSLLPISLDHLQVQHVNFKLFGLFVFWLLGQLIWLNFGYQLQFLRVNSFQNLMYSGCLFTLINGFVIGKFLQFRKIFEVENKND